MWTDLPQPCLLTWSLKRLRKLPSITFKTLLSRNKLWAFKDVFLSDLCSLGALPKRHGETCGSGFCWRTLWAIYNAMLSLAGIAPWAACFLYFSEDPVPGSRKSGKNLLKWQVRKAIIHEFVQDRTAVFHLLAATNWDSLLQNLTAVSGSVGQQRPNPGSASICKTVPWQ